MTTCSACGTGGQPAAARFCFSCGAGLQAPGCPSCGVDVVPGARFCSSCGAAQGAMGPTSTAAPGAGPVASRRVTSVLFGDLVGFTSLAETRDQEDVRELLSHYFEEARQVVVRYGGTVEKFIGDAVMAVWGVPTMHEDDAERSVRAGLELVNAVAGMGADLGVPDLAMRVGIVTGEVAVTIGAEQQGMVAGDAVNTASRVQSAASPGQVWVDETTRLLTASAISYVDVGSHALKGKADPVPLWAARAVVAGIGGTQRADGLEAPLVGRDRELRVVKEVFHGVGETGRPGMLIVSGEPGVGKTRLGWEFEKYTDGLQTTTWWHSGRCLAYGEGVAFYALSEAVRGRLLALQPEDADAEEGDAEQTALLARGLEAYCRDAEDRAWLEPRLSALLGIGPVRSFPREDLFTAWTTFLERIGGGSETVVLVIDDAHHADEGLVSFLEHLMAVATFPVFVLLMARPGLVETRPALVVNPRSTLVHLEPLTPANLGTLCDGLVSGLPDRVRDALVERAAGVPLFAVETVRSLIDQDLVLPRGGQYVLADPGTLDLDSLVPPVSLQALIAARLDTLGPAERTVLDRASVLGLSFTRQAVERICADVADLGAALAGLTRLQLLRQQSDRLSAERGHYQFVQSAVRQVAYGTLSRRDRKAIHLSVVEVLGTDDNSAGEISAILAQHLLEAIDAVPDAEDGEALTDAAVDHLRRAAEHAGSLGAPAEAAGHLEAALARIADPALGATIETSLAEQLARSGDHARAIHHAGHATEVLDGLGDRVGAALATAAECRSLVLSSASYQRALDLATERMASLEGVPESHRAQLALSQSRVQTLMRSGLDLREAAEQHVRLAEHWGDEHEVTDSYISIGLHYGLVGLRGLGQVLLEAAAERARTRHDPRTHMVAKINLAADLIQDDLSRATQFAREAVALGRQLNEVSYVDTAVANLVMAHGASGAWDEALEVSLERPAGVDVMLVELVRCSIAAARGESWEPRYGPLDETDDVSALAADTAVRAWQRTRSGEPGAATLMVESARLMHSYSGILDDFTVLWQFLTDLAWESGDHQALLGLFEVLEQGDVEDRSTGLRAQVARMEGLAAIRDGDDDRVEASLRTSIAEADRWGSAVLRARSQADLGSWLAGHARHDDAAPLLEAARATFEELRATTWARDLDRRLAGATP